MPRQSLPVRSLLSLQFAEDFASNKLPSFSRLSHFPLYFPLVVSFSLVWLQTACHLCREAYLSLYPCISSRYLSQLSQLFTPCRC